MLAPPGFRMKIWAKKKSPLYVYVSSSISQTYNKLCAPFENKMREIYFYKEVFRWIMFLVDSVRSIQHLYLSISYNQCNLSLNRP